MVTLLDKDEMELSIEKLNQSAPIQWSIRDGKLSASISFNNFVEAFGFMTKVAIVAERLNHHPEWSNVYKLVKIHLITHEVDGITEKDFQFANEISGLIFSSPNL